MGIRAAEVLTHDSCETGFPDHLSVPDHATLDRGILRDLIRDAGISVDRFIELLRK